MPETLYVAKPVLDSVFIETESTFRATEDHDIYYDYQGVLCAPYDRLNYIAETYRTRNLRTAPGYKDKFNRNFYEFIGDVGQPHPSFHRENRGSFADPDQIFQLSMDIQSRGLTIIGTIHGHMMFNPEKANELCYRVGDNPTKFDYILWKFTQLPYHLISWNGRHSGCNHLMKSASAYKSNDENWERMDLRVVVDNKDYPPEQFYDLYTSRNFQEW